MSRQQPSIVTHASSAAQQQAWCQQVLILCMQKSDVAVVQSFLEAVGGRGMGALELVAMDMKARGMYVCRTLSFAGRPLPTSALLPLDPAPPPLPHPSCTWLLTQLNSWCPCVSFYPFMLYACIGAHGCLPFTMHCSVSCEHVTNTSHRVGWRLESAAWFLFSVWRQVTFFNTGPVELWPFLRLH